MNKQRTVRPQIGSFAIVPAWTPRRIRRAADSAAAFATGMTLYVILRLHATKDLLAIPRIETLAKEIAPDGAPVHVSTLKRAIKLLRAAGVIKTERRRNDRGAVVGTNYILIDVEPAQEDEQQLTGEPLPEGEGSSEQPLTGEPLSIGLQLTGEPDTSSQVSEWGASDRSITELHELNQKKDLSAKSVPTPAFTLIQDYVDGFFAAFGFKPVVGGREGKILKELAEQVGEDRVRLLLVHRICRWHRVRARLVLPQSGQVAEGHEQLHRADVEGLREPTAAVVSAARGRVANHRDGRLGAGARADQNRGRQPRVLHLVQEHDVHPSCWPEPRRQRAES